MRKKISVIGAGNVGREAAAWLAMKELGDIVLWNRSADKAVGNALDLIEAGPLVGFDSRIIGTDKLEDTKKSDIIVFTSGAPRKPGMSREELVQGNAEVVFPLVKKLAKLSPKAVLIMVTNPLDVMTHVALKASKFHRRKVIGMAGILDSSRFRSFIALELGISVNEISALVLGSHGENMVPVPKFSTVGGIPLTALLTPEKIDSLVKHTKDAGAEIVKLLNSNASFSVGAAIAKLVETIVKDEKQILPCSVQLKGEYGLNDVFIGVPCIVGENGLEKIVTLPLEENEQRQLMEAAERIKGLIKEVKL